MSNFIKIFSMSIRRLGIIDTIKELPFILEFVHQMNICDKALKRLTEDEN